MRYFIAIFFIILFQAVGFAGQAQKVVLNNGLTLIVKESPRTGLAAVSVFIVSMALNQESGDSGASSMLSALLTKGSRNYSAEALAEKLEEVGASLQVNNDTDYIELAYLSQAKDLLLGLKLINEALFFAEFPDNEIKKTKNNAIAAIEQIPDAPDQLVNEELMHLLYPRHYYGIKSQQMISGIKKITRDDIKKYYKKHFVPSNIVISIVGDAASNEVVSFCKKTFFSDRGGNSKVSGNDQLPKGGLKTIKKKDLKADWLEIGYSTVPVNDPDHIALKVLSSILGSGMSSRLFVEVRKKEALVYSIGSYLPSRKYRSPFIIYAVAGPKNLEKVKTMIFAEIDKLKNAKATEVELKRNKSLINGKFTIDHQGIAREAWYLGFFEASGLGYEADSTLKNNINAVTVTDLQRVAQKYLNKPSTVILAPQ